MRVMSVLPALLLAMASQLAQAGEIMAFDAAPMADPALAAVHGMGIGTLRGTTVRLLADGQVGGALRQAGETSRIIMDNWWSQTGAALIYSNILAERSGR